MRRLLAVIVVPLVISLTTAAGQAVHTSSHPRPFSVDDALSIESLGELRISPDGALLAAVTHPGAGRARRKPNWFLSDSVLWLIALDGGTRWVLTDSARQLSGVRSVWQPRWSPSGRYLAFLYTFGVEKGVFLGVWSRVSRQMVGTARLPVDWASTLVTCCDMAGAFAWLGDSSLAYVSIDGSPRPVATDYESLTQRLAPRQWSRAESGDTATASALDSPGDSARGPQSRALLVTVDVPHHLRASAHDVGTVWNTVNVSFASDKHQFAVRTSVAPLIPEEHGRIRRAAWSGRSALGIGDLTAKGSVHWVDTTGLSARLPLELNPEQSCWTPDGRTFVVRSGSGLLPSDRVIAIDEQARASTLRIDSTESIMAILCVPGGEVWARVSRLPADAERTNWLRMSLATGSVQPLSSDVGNLPADLHVVRDASMAIGVTSSALMALRTARSDGPPVTVRLESNEVPLRLEALSEPRSRGTVVAFVRTGEADSASLHRVEIFKDSVHVSHLTLPAPGATLLAAQEPGNIQLFRSHAAGGELTLWSGTGTSARPLLHLNAFLRNIAPPQRRLFRYVTPTGDSLTAMVALPGRARPPKGYPTVFSIYPGAMHSDTDAFEFDREHNGALNLELLTAHGYAVVLPSLPMPPDGTPSDPYVEIPKYVNAAVDRAVALGIADSNRLALMGHSFGGYAAYVMATATTRFRAIVSLAGLSNLVSLYGQFDPRQRYSDQVQQNGLMAALMEDGQILMGGPPYDDHARYWRNSALAYVDNVRTPLLIIQGDLDYVPMSQGEEFFSALYRLGRRARFVRYFGEGHEVISPANVHSEWKEIYGWLDRYLGVDPRGAH